MSPVECNLVVGLYPGERRCGDGLNGAGMGGNGGGGRVNGRFVGSRSNLGSGGDGGISTVDTSIKWSKTTPTMYPPSSVNGESVRLGISAIGCATW